MNKQKKKRKGGRGREKDDGERGPTYKVNEGVCGDDLVQLNNVWVT